MNVERTGKQTHGQRIEPTMPYVIELQTSIGPPTYVVAQAVTRDDARALIDAHLGRDDANDDVIIIAVHPIH